jgi:hypothetical protein
MEIDKSIYRDIKNLFLKIRILILSCWNYKFKILKWGLIILTLFILYRVYKIITYHKVVRSYPVANKTISIKKTGYYRLGVYLNINQKYFFKRNVIADILFNNKNGKIKHNKNILLKSLESEFYYYCGKININSLKNRNYDNRPYRHLRFTSVISNFKNGDNPFFFFYVNFASKNKLERILYTPINIPINNILADHVVIAKVRSNGYLRLLNLPGNKKPEIRINKLIYFYPHYTTDGNVNNIEAVFEYKYKNEKLNKTIGIYSGELINIYKLLKNKKNKGKDIKLIKVIFKYKTFKNKKGSIKFTGSKLIEPNISSLEKIFKNFIFKKYFINFMRHSQVFKRELKKQIIKGKKKLIPYSKVKKNFIDNTVKKIFLIDYNTKITHISNIHNKIVRAFYRFIYKNYTYSYSFTNDIANIFSHKRIWYKNILIPIKMNSIKFKVVHQNNTDRNKKIVYISINFKKLKLYKYFTNDKEMLNEIINKKKSVKINNKLVLRGSNDDYWYGKRYYRNYPLLRKIKLFIFNKKPGNINSYFYYNSLPKAYPKVLLMNTKNFYLPNMEILNFKRKTVQYKYNNILNVIRKYNKVGPYNFFNNLNIFDEKYKIFNIKEKEKEKEKDYILLNKAYYSKINSFNSLKKIIILKFNNINIKNFQNILIKIYSDKELKYFNNFGKLYAIVLNTHNINKLILLPVNIENINNSKYADIHLIRNRNIFKNKLFIINEIKLEFMPKKISESNLYQYRQINFNVIGNNIVFLKFKKTNKTLLKYINESPFIDLKYDDNKEKLISFKKFINRRREFNKIFEKGSGWIYKKLYLKKGVYCFNLINNTFFKTYMITLERLNEK